MIAFSPVRTKRLTVELNELTAGDVIALCALPPDQPEAGASQLLSRIVQPVDKPRIGQVTDPRLWTVQERAFVIAHYIAHVSQGDPDFTIGDRGAKFSDYIVEGKDAAPDTLELGTVADDYWLMQPLLGAHAESIERLVVSGRLPAKQHGWWVGAMAAQLYTSNQQPFDVVNGMDAELDEYLANRAQILLAFPESDFMDLLHTYLASIDKAEHLLRLDFIDSGLVFMPVKEVPGPIPARFPVSFAISERAAQAFGRPQ